MTPHLLYLVKWILVSERASPSTIATIWSTEFPDSVLFPTRNILAGLLVCLAASFFGQGRKEFDINLSQDLYDHRCQLRKNMHDRGVSTRSSQNFNCLN